MTDQALRVGMDVVERTLQNLADEYAVTIAEYHWGLDESGAELPQRLCFYVQGHGDPYGLEFPARQLAALADARSLADRATVEHTIRETMRSLTT